LEERSKQKVSTLSGGSVTVAMTLKKKKRIAADEPTMI
jgi:ABC-type phosphate/phosphonate transport system ATPase subunit